MTKKQILPAGVFAHHRAAVTSHYAVMPPEGILESRIPGIDKTTVSVQATPGLGAKFAQLLLEIQSGGGMAHERNDGMQSFFYVVSGNPTLEISGQEHLLKPGSFAYASAGTGVRLYNPETDASNVIWIKKPYERLEGVSAAEPFVSHEGNIEKVNKHTKGRTWQHLLPDENPAFDFAINILSFEPGNYFPMVETHVMEHGLYMLEGQGMYLLQNDWHECWAQDFIYMAPFCPQFFYATGWSKASYLLYKNVNRDITF
ncbi:(S)-ureidoglycine aminohydrolase [Caballeronia sp. INDeC2]|uniref:(S)-ureidoglycine aminohydrolase n=1 Tax=Caballeronia sp. INDeC2 TaxID=2921747 RepID=UPI0020289712|nr:(S)-ureidoglycine aminohydrolase [Caballeronia sp. INDeC2]